MLKVFRRGDFPIRESQAHGVVHVTIFLGPPGREDRTAS
jgi:hypothetical protein